MSSNFLTLLIALYGAENAGVRYLSSALKKAGFPCRIIFFKNWKNNDLKPPTKKEIELLLTLVSEKKPALVGISLISSFFELAGDLTSRIKALGIPVIWGGIHPTACPEKCLQYADLVCQGEGELTLVELVEKLSRKESPENIPGLALNLNGKVKINPLRNLIPDLDSLSYPDLAGENKFLIEQNRIVIGEPFFAGAEYRIYLSRGCPFACSYCYNSILKAKYRGLGRYYRYRSVEHAFGELEMVKKLMPNLRRVKIDDDTSFCYGKTWLDEFVEKYPSRIGVPFEAMLNPYLLSPLLLSKLKKAGLVKIQVGIETGSKEQMEKAFGRKALNARLLEFSRQNQKLKLEVVYDLIIDNPLAKVEDQRSDVELLLKLERPFKVYLYSLVNFPGTLLSQKLLAEGRITPELLEDRAKKAWRQFRVDFSYPRKKEELFYLSLLTLTSKDFIPKKLIYRWLDSDFLQKYPGVICLFARGVNLLRMLQVAWQMAKNRELTWFKIKQYASLSKLISQ